jgi:hypothetical protein
MAASGYKYFIFSASQLKDRSEIEKSIGKTFKPGEVAVGPKKKKYTEMNSTGTSRYSDAKIVAEGDISKMKYTDIRSV